MIRLPRRSDIELDLEGEIEVCQVEGEGRTYWALGTVCAKTDNVRIWWFSKWQVALGVWRRGSGDGPGRLGQTGRALNARLGS